MRFITPLLLALTVALSVQAAGPAQWECLDTSGHKVVQDHPCGEGLEFGAQSVPIYVWGIVAVLGVVWLLALMPQRIFRFRSTAPAIPELQPVGLPPLPEAPESRSRPPPAARAPAAAPRPASWSPEAIGQLSPRRFEELIQVLWQANNYKAVLTGTDVKIHGAGGRLFAVAQCLPSTGQPVGAEPVRALWEAVQQHGAGLGVCYGPAGFAMGALAFAEGKRLKLVSGAELLAQIRMLKPEQQQTLLEHIWRP